MDAPTLLVIDDSLSSRRMIRRFADALGVRIIGEACDGEEAIPLYKRYRPTLVTLDLVLPILDGVSVARVLHAYDRRCKIIICSSAGSRDRAAACKAAGAADFLLKPLDEARFCQSVRRILTLDHSELHA
jgi:two-component system chemotaxis response regulator CheY